MTTLRSRSGRTIAALTAVLVALGLGAFVWSSRVLGPPSISSPTQATSVSVGIWAQVAEVNELELRERPSADAATTGTLAEGERVFVTDEASSSGGSWIRIQGSDPDRPVFGWIRQTSPAGPLHPVEPPSCPQRPNVLAVVYLGPAERLTCFRSRPLTFETVVFAATSPPATYSGTPEWLADPPGTQLWGELGIDSPGGALSVSVLPGLAVPSDSGWYQVTGRFDDPASETCDVSMDGRPLDDTEARLWCRERFVVTAVAPAPEPKPSRDTGPTTPGAPG